MMFATLSTLVLLCAIPVVYGHGFVSQVTINGKAYKGNAPWAEFPDEKQVDSPVRRTKTFGPQYGAENPTINCGPKAEKAALVVDADPGSQISFLWVANDDVKDSHANWPHEIGPLETYMASCGNTSCKDFDSTHAQWFKIDEVGKKPNSDQWVQQALMARKPYTLTLPRNIVPGDYLIRHEIIALHIADKFQKAEFYVSCTQVHMTGDGDGAPSANEQVTFPGGYHDSDPGLYNDNFFDHGAKYTFPGPKIAQFVLDASDKKTSAGNGNATTTGNTHGTSTITPTSRSSTSVPSRNTSAAPSDPECSASPTHTTYGNSHSSGSAKRDEKKMTNRHSKPE